LKRTSGVAIDELGEDERQRGRSQEVASLDNLVGIVDVTFKLKLKNRTRNSTLPPCASGSLSP
jgi:hypothetical protein